MADPVWGPALSLSEEETARTLCAFHDRETIPIQRRRLLRAQQEQVCHESNPEMPQVNGLLTFGYPSNGTYYVRPLSGQRDEVVSLLVGTNAPSTSSNDWRQQQQDTIQDQLTQQEELRIQMNQEQPQEIQTQMQHMEVQLWQQKQVQAQRVMERILHPRYSTSAGELDQTEWSNHVHTSRACSPCLHSGEDRRTVTHRCVLQPRQVHHARVGCSEQLPGRITTASMPTQSYMSDDKGNSQSSVSMGINDGVVAIQEDSQIVPSHSQAQNHENFMISAVHQWKRHKLMLLAGIQSDRSKMPRMQQTWQRYFYQPTLQPQPCYPTEINRRSRQVMGALGQASGSSLNETFLDGIMEHFSTNAAPTAGNAPTASAGSNTVLVKAQGNEAMYNAILARSRTQNGAGMQTQRRSNTLPRPPILPSRAAVVPGVSLAPQDVRLLTMRDILNCEDGSGKTDSWRNQPQGGKQQRASSKRKMPRKRTPVKRQKVLQERSAQNSQPQPPTRLAGSIMPYQSANGVRVSAFVPTTRPSTPMHLAFLESRAARASEQAAGVTNTRLSILTSHSQSMLAAPVDELSTKVANRNIAAYEGSNSVSRKTANATSDMSDSSATCQSMQQHTKKLHHDTAKQLSSYGSIFSKAAKGARSLIRLDAVENGKDAMIPKKMSKAKRPRARLILPTVGDRDQQVHEIPPDEGLILRTESIGATAVVPATSVVSGMPRTENRTVVIFCKRDFMRYQAARIWRKYQEQLKKHEEWREVRVAGKRTRYLNSRYDDEIQRAHSKTFSRLGRRSKPLQEKGRSRSDKASLTSAGLASVRQVVSSRVPGDNKTDERNLSLRGRGGLTASVDLSNASGDCSLSGKLGVADGAESSVTTECVTARRPAAERTKGNTKALESSNDFEP
ncbi:unnamed protein product [Peronospora belbahrii]|uniref:Uncharacterized protein n=1 Tax=Peronospora belbahrii TaxID=622444 RepID=A0AAU9LDU4_9STRA|nr:unnamed protein product [Peronospora belbahrii]CAH0517303.1 unnamed protein product [Peronospora belbahrii]